VSDPVPPPPGNMYLYDDITPPLFDNSYRFTVKTDVTLNGAAQPLPTAVNYFNIDGPRFTLAATEVSGVFPPRNGHGAFDETIAHIALGRRTLPWERDPQLPPPLRPPGDPPPPNPRPAVDPSGAVLPGVSIGGPVPWLALLVFEEGEYTLNQNVPLEQVVPQDVFKRLGSPAGIRCDSLSASLELIAALMPSVDELTLLSHVRQVNVDDRELSAGHSDGWFAVVTSNRLPNPGAKCRACLVSVEERSDIVPANPPPTFVPPFQRALVNLGVEAVPIAAPAAATRAAAFTGAGRVGRIGTVNPGVLGGVFIETVSLVLLHSWQYECNFTGTFRELMQGLDVGMIGKVQDVGHPALTDTGHLQLQLEDRAGVPETVLYRGPLVPFQLTRDNLGPCHSADQCRRATPETGAEDVSYAAAFEVGRLLAAADGRLAQELMRWRREAYKQSARADVKVAVTNAISLVEALDLHQPWVPVVSASAATSVAKGAGPIADAFGLSAVARAPGLDPQAVQQAWGLARVDEAVAILGGEPGVLGAQVTAPPQTARPNATLDSVTADQASLDRLSVARDRVLFNAQTKLEGQR
jgi:hypothetical protein